MGLPRYSNRECNFTIQGIFISSSINTKLKYISVAHSSVGVLVSGSKYTTIVDLHVMENTIGLHVNHNWANEPMSAVTLIKNTCVTKNVVGIYVSQSVGVVIVNVIATRMKNVSIHMKYCSNTTLNGATIVKGDESDTMNFQILVINCSYTALKNITVTSIKSAVGSIEKQLVGQIQHSGITFFHCETVYLENSTFTNIHSNSVTSTADVRNQPAVITTYNTELFLMNCSFMNNHISSIRAIASTIVAEGNVHFCNISAISGAGFIFSKNSILLPLEGSSVVFENNHASGYGAAFYIETEQFMGIAVSLDRVVQMETFHKGLSSLTKCFVRVIGSRSTARLKFINNRAEKGGDVVYGGQVVSGYDGEWNCLHSFKNISDMTRQSSDTPYRRVASDPSRVCICRDERPDCLIVADTTQHALYPGQTMTVSAAAVGQDFGTVKGEVHTQFLSSSESDISVLNEQQIVQYENKGCKPFNFTVYSTCGDCMAKLVLTTDGREVSKVMTIADNAKLRSIWSIVSSTLNPFTLKSRIWSGLLKLDFVRVQNVIGRFYSFEDYSYGDMFSQGVLRFPIEIYTYPLYINVSFQPCPLGLTPYNSRCDCINLLQQIPSVECDIQGPSITRGGSVWIGTYGNQTVAVSKYCPLYYCKTETTELSLHAPSTNSSHSQCNYRHAGILCGGCQRGLSLALGSEQCLQCSNAYISLILLFALAGILLIVFLKVLNFTVCQGNINGFIFYANVINANKHLYYEQTPTTPITLFIAWFNLDLGIETCFYDGLTVYARTWLQFVFPIYIWCLAGGIIFLANRSRRVAKLSGNNGVPVLATLFLLSYAKIFTTIIKIVTHTKLHTTEGDKLVWSVDGNIDYLGSKHAALFAAAVVALVFLWLPYTLLLLLGKYLHRINCRPVTRTLMKLKPFLDAHYAPFHDRHQHWFGGILIVKAVVLLSSALIPENGTHIVVYSIAIASLLLTFWGQRVFHKNANTTFHVLFFVNLSLLNITRLFFFNDLDNMSKASYILIGLTLVNFLGLVLFKVINYSRSVLGSRGWDYCHCFTKGARDGDDWELYFQASVDRNEESKNDEERETERSIESQPTY